MTTEPSVATPPEQAKASGYAWYALTVLVLVYVFNFVDTRSSASLPRT